MKVIGVLCAGLVLGVLIKILIDVFDHKKRKKARDLTRFIFEKKYPNYQIVDVHKENKNVDLWIQTEKNRYLVHILMISPDCELVINSRLHWQCFYGTMNSKAPKSNHMISSIKGFMSLSLEENTHRIVVVYPNVHLLKKYINECEMIFVDPSRDCHGTRVIRFIELEEKMSDLEIE